MPDITCCYGEDAKLDGDKITRTSENICPMRGNCYRYTVLPSKYMQSYFADLPYDKVKKTCSYYSPNEPEAA